MKQTVIQQFRDLLATILQELGITETTIPVEINKNQAQGQLSTTIALVAGKKNGFNPLELANQIKTKLEEHDQILAVEIAGPGFINVELKPEYLSQVIGQVKTLQDQYGASDPKDYKISLELVSANPTGFLHVAHGRNAVIGDALNRIFKFNGYQVETEYYLNDAGNQINLLALTVFVNYLNLLGKKTELPKNCYKGEGYDTVAQLIIDQKGDQFLEVGFDDSKILDEATNDYFRKVSSDYFLDIIKKQLAMLDVSIEHYQSEAALYPKTTDVLKEFADFGATYLKDGALFLNTTKFGDDKDRVLVKSDGTYTYLTADLVNHHLRIKRSQANKLINVWGGDHHGYIARMRAGLQWLGNPADILEIEMIQMVRVIKDGQEYKMSKRKGTAVWLVDILEAMGKDALRYMLASKASSSHMDLDLNLIHQKNASNPVYYAQYATARLNSILRQAKENNLTANFEASTLLQEPKELELLIILDNLQETVNQAAKNRLPSVITDYIQKVATHFHSYYAEYKIIDLEKPELSAARLGLVETILQVLSNAFALIGLNVVEEM